jgi:hypothetical protein
MSDKKPTPKPQGPDVSNTKCPVEKCAKPVERLNFCGEHFDWFKAGLVNRRGEKPTDFDKKYQAWQRRQRKAA